MRSACGLFLPRLAIGIAAVAFGLSRGLILDDPGDQALDPLAAFAFGQCRRIKCRLTFCNLVIKALLLLLTRLALEPVALGVPRVSGGGNRTPLFQPRQPGRLGRGHRGAVGLKLCRLGVGCSAATPGKIVGFGIYQIGIL